MLHGIIFRWVILVAYLILVINKTKSNTTRSGIVSCIRLHVSAFLD